MEEKIFQVVKNYKKASINFLKQLVMTPSQNGIDTERRIADIIVKELEKMGLEVKEVGSYERPSLISSFGKGKKTIILNAHMDTVPAGEKKKWKYSPFSAIVRRGKLYGRGAADSKAGIAQIVYSLNALLQIESQLNGKVIVCFDSDEESGNFTGMKELLKNGLRGDIALLAYPGNNELIVGARGLLRFALITYGKMWHTGSREKMGENAIYRMVQVIDLLRKLKFEFKKDSDFYFGPKLTVSLINGGTAINLVPDKCEIKVDFRTIPSMDKKSIIAMIKRHIREKLPLCKFSLEELMYYPPFKTDKNHSLIKIILEISKKILKKTPRLACAGSSNVGNLLSQYKIPAICFGASFGNVHTYDEWVSIKSFIKMIKIYGLSIFRFLS